MPAFLTSQSPWAHVATSQGMRRMLILLTLPSDQSCPTAAYYSPTEAIRQAQGDNRRSSPKIASEDCHFGIQHLKIHPPPAHISPKLTQVNLHWVSDPQYPTPCSPEAYTGAFSSRTLSVSLLPPWNHMSHGLCFWSELLTSPVCVHLCLSSDS